MNLEEQISSVLSDPEAMSKISSIVSALGGGGASPAPQSAPQAQQQPQQPQPPSPTPQPQPTLPAGLQNLNLPDLGNDNRTRLLMAVKPFLSEKRAPYVDGAVALLRMMQLGKLGKDMKLF